MSFGDGLPKLTMVATLFRFYLKGIFGLLDVQVMLALSINEGGDAMTMMWNATIAVVSILVGAFTDCHAEAIPPYGRSPLTSP